MPGRTSTGRRSARATPAPHGTQESDARPAHTSSSELVCLVDLMATCGAIVGQALPGNCAEDSYNILPALLDPSPQAYTSARMTYDLRRLRLHRLIQRVPGRNRYVLTPRGRRIALFFSKSYARVLRPALARTDPQAPEWADDRLRSAWRRLDAAIERHVLEAKLAA